MRAALQTALASVFGVLLVTSAAFGGGLVGSAQAQTSDACEPDLVDVILPQLYPCGQPDADAYGGTNATETQLNIYDQASIQKQNSKVITTAFSNYLNDTQTIALMEGKNSYIRALNDNATEQNATDAAMAAINDYYVVKQENLIAQWNTTMIMGVSAIKQAQNSSDVNNTYVRFDYTSTEGPVTVEDLHSPNLTRTVTLVNGDSHEVASPGAQVHVDKGSDTFIYTPYIKPSDAINTTVNDNPPVTLDGFVVEEPNGTDLGSLDFGSTKEVHRSWHAIEAQANQTRDQMQTFINGTYSEYQAGEINDTALIDPYLGAREYSPENASQFQSWSLQSLTAMGLNSPENLSTTGLMNITTTETVNNTTTNVTFTGILMSDGTSDGGFTVGNTYDPAKITGVQYVALDQGGSVKLSEPFTLESATTADGTVIEKNETITYTNVTYQTANTTEVKALQDQLDKLQAEVNAYEQNNDASGGGGLLPDFGFSFGLGGAGVPATLIAAGGVAFIILSRN